MRLAVVGSRCLAGDEVRRCLYRLLDSIHSVTPITMIVSGGARGVDTLATDWAHFRRIAYQVFTPDWDAHGRRAGFIRNGEIVAASDRVLAVWDGVSHGTADTIDRAQRAGLPVQVVPIHRLPAAEVRTDGRRMFSVLLTNERTRTKGKKGLRSAAANQPDLDYLLTPSIALTVGDVIRTVTVSQVFDSCEIRTHDYTVRRARGERGQVAGRTRPLDRYTALTDSAGVTRSLGDVLLQIRQGERTLTPHEQRVKAIKDAEKHATECRGYVRDNQGWRLSRFWTPDDFDGKGNLRLPERQTETPADTRRLATSMDGGSAAERHGRRERPRFADGTERELTPEEICEPYPDVLPGASDYDAYAVIGDTIDADEFGENYQTEPEQRVDLKYGFIDLSALGSYTFRRTKKEQRIHDHNQRRHHERKKPAALTPDPDYTVEELAA